MFQTRLLACHVWNRHISQEVGKGGQVWGDVEAVGFTVQNVYKMTYGDENATFEPVNGPPPSKAISVHHFPSNCYHFYPCPIHKVKEGNASLPVYLLTSYKNNDELNFIWLLRSLILGKRNHQFKVENLSRFLVYILGHRPDEFGLVPDSDGFVTYKELLQAIHEEPDWHYVRRSHINEVLLGKDRHLFQPSNNRIKTAERRWQFYIEKPSQPLPKLLFTPVRRKAHPVVMEKGIRSGKGKYLVLSSDQEMAGRIGSRRDQKPVLLEVMADIAQSEGILFYPFGNLFLTPEIPARFLAGPPVPKEILDRGRDAEPKKGKIVERQAVLTPGTFPLDSSRDPDPYRRAKGKKRKSWKEEARKMRRGKRR